MMCQFLRSERPFECPTEPTAQSLRYFRTVFLVAAFVALARGVAFSALGHGYQSIRFAPTNTIIPALISRPRVNIFTTPCRSCNGPPARTRCRWLPRAFPVWHDAATYFASMIQAYFSRIVALRKPEQQSQ
jgi:hypothetical protein